MNTLFSLRDKFTSKWMGVCFVFIFMTAYSTKASMNEVPSPPLKFVPVITSGLDNPGFVAVTASDSSRMFVTERTGRIRVIRNDSLLVHPFLDLSDKVDTLYSSQDYTWSSDWTRDGLASLAFPPDYRDSGYFFVLYTTIDESTDSISLIIERFRVSENPDSADQNSGVVVLSIPISRGTVYKEHSSFGIGKDSLMYIAVAEYTFFENFIYNPFPGLGPRDLKGKLLRIDARSLPYAIPPTNPYATSIDTANEIMDISGYANPRFMAIDQQRGSLYIVDGYCESYGTAYRVRRLNQGVHVSDTPWVFHS